MKTTDNQLLALLKAGLWKAVPDESLFKQCDWKALYKQASTQTVQGVVLDGAGLLSKEVRPPFSLLASWIGEIHQRLENVNRKHIDVIGKVRDLLENEGISVAFMKGETVARRYLNPLRRMAGDIDFLVSSNDFQQTLDLLDTIGHTDRTLVHEHHGMAFVDGVVLEPHYKIHNYQRPSTDRRMQDLVNEVFPSRLQRVDLGKGLVPVLPVTFESAFLISHIVNHIYEEGLGLRQIVDYAVLLQQEWNNIDWDTHTNYLRRIRMYRAWRIVTCLCQDFIGVEKHWEFSAKEHQWAKRLMDDIMEVGNFGRGKYTFRYDTALHKLDNYRWVSMRAWHMGFVCPSEAAWWPISKCFRFFWKQTK